MSKDTGCDLCFRPSVGRNIPKYPTKAAKTPLFLQLLAEGRAGPCDPDYDILHTYNICIDCRPFAEKEVVKLITDLRVAISLMKARQLKQLNTKTGVVK
jgi:hypothetical protein